MDVDSLHAVMPMQPATYKPQTPPDSSSQPPSSGEASKATPSVNTEKQAENRKLGSDKRGEERELPNKHENKLTSNFLEKTIDQANKELENTGREFNYSVHEKTGEFMVKIIDSETKEVIREIPPEKTLDAVAKMWELAGILVDEKK